MSVFSDRNINTIKAGRDLVRPVFYCVLSKYEVKVIAKIPKIKETEVFLKKEKKTNSSKTLIPSSLVTLLLLFEKVRKNNHDQ